MLEGIDLYRTSAAVLEASLNYKLVSLPWILHLHCSPSSSIILFPLGIITLFKDLCIYFSCKSLFTLHHYYYYKFPVLLFCLNKVHCRKQMLTWGEVNEKAKGWPHRESFLNASTTKKCNITQPACCFQMLINFTAYHESSLAE